MKIDNIRRSQVCLKDTHLYDIMEEMIMASYDDLIFSTHDLIFEKALDYLKHGYRISRDGWNGKGKYIVLKQGVEIHDKDDEEEYPDFLSPYDIGNLILLKTFKNKGHFVPWCPNQTDILADDWFVYDD